MTEDEAESKWCPFSRFQSRLDEGGANRWKQDAPPDEPYALNPVPCRCIGSACMAWRWEREQINECSPRMTRRSETDGYCGLAGKP